MIIKSKIMVICLQPPEGLKFNIIYKLIDRFFLLCEDPNVPVTPNNPNTRKSDQIRNITNILRETT